MPEQKEMTSYLSVYTSDCNAFCQLDEPTQDAIIYDISEALCISRTDAEDIAKCLYYEPVETSSDTYLCYKIPNFLIRKCFFDKKD